MTAERLNSLLKFFRRNLMAKAVAFLLTTAKQRTLPNKSYSSFAN